LSISLGLRASGVYLSILIAEASIAVASMLLFRRGRWKLKQI
jgi:hypothetical protein